MDLLPCPFCGGKAERLELEDGDNFGGSCICCKQCGASSAVHFDRKENLESSWNERRECAAERKAISEETRRYAGHYSEGSDGRNTFIMLAEWIENRDRASAARDLILNH